MSLLNVDQTSDYCILRNPTKILLPPPSSAKITREGGGTMKNSDIIILKRKVIAENPDGTPKEVYSEITIGRTTYCITSAFSGEVNLKQTLERLAVAKVLSEIETQRRRPVSQQSSKNNTENTSEN